MKRVAIFPGSFDPFTLGHESIVLRALPLFDEIVIAVGYNTQKSGFFDLEKRKSWIETVFENEAKVRVESYQGLTADYCKRNGIQFILRGLRSSIDFEYERPIAHLNSSMFAGLETVFMLTLQEHSSISSSVVREIYRHGGDVTNFLPKAMKISK